MIEYCAFIPRAGIIQLTLDTVLIVFYDKCSIMLQENSAVANEYNLRLAMILNSHLILMIKIACMRPLEENGTAFFPLLGTTR